MLQSNRQTEPRPVSASRWRQSSQRCIIWLEMANDKGCQVGLLVYNDKWKRQPKKWKYFEFEVRLFSGSPLIILLV